MDRDKKNSYRTVVAFCKLWKGNKAADTLEEIAGRVHTTREAFSRAAILSERAAEEFDGLSDRKSAARCRILMARCLLEKVFGRSRNMLPRPGDRTDVEKAMSVLRSPEGTGYSVNRYIFLVMEQRFPTEAADLYRLLLLTNRCGGRELARVLEDYHTLLLRLHREDEVRVIEERIAGMLEDFSDCFSDKLIATTSSIAPAKASRLLQIRAADDEKRGNLFAAGDLHMSSARLLRRAGDFEGALREYMAAEDDRKGARDFIGAWYASFMVRRVAQQARLKKGQEAA